MRAPQVITEVKYYELKDYCLYHGMNYGIKKIDCEDILHDACVYILENNITPNDYKWCILKFIGKYRERRHREGTREVKYNDKEDNQNV
tara:strand:+ start:157 stop:423 length:267 start_codon:yes stop_codon:yes gene_type:complete